MARPAIASTRLRIARDGDVIYGFKRNWKDGSEAIELFAIAFLERLAALVPRPRHTTDGQNCSSASSPTKS